MKKTFILFSFLLFQAFAFGQIKEISFGTTPYGHLKVRPSKSKVDSLSYTYSLSNPALHFGFGWRQGHTESLIEVFYAKENPTDKTGYNGFITSHFALRGYRGYTLLYGKRVQIPFYFGIGLSYYSQPIPTELSLDLGGRIRTRVYVTNKLALYAGWYFFVSYNENKVIKNELFHSGYETGLMYNF